MKNNKKSANEWFAKGDKDLKAALLLFQQGRDIDIVPFHIQQTIDKCLKDF
jgi:HEPN domain-containing protein